MLFITVVDQQNLTWPPLSPLKNQKPHKLKLGKITCKHYLHNLSLVLSQGLATSLYASPTHLQSYMNSPMASHLTQHKTKDLSRRLLTTFLTPHFLVYSILVCPLLAALQNMTVSFSLYRFFALLFLLPGIFFHGSSHGFFSSGVFPDLHFIR